MTQDRLRQMKAAKITDFFSSVKVSLTPTIFIEPEVEQPTQRAQAGGQCLADPADQA